MGVCSGYAAQALAEKHGKCGRNVKGEYWEHGGVRYYFRDGTARRWFAKAKVEDTLDTLHSYSQPLFQEDI